MRIFHSNESCQLAPILPLFTDGHYVRSVWRVCSLTDTTNQNKNAIFLCSALHATEKFHPLQKPLRSSGIMSMCASIAPLFFGGEKDTILIWMKRSHLDRRLQWITANIINPLEILVLYFLAPTISMPEKHKISKNSRFFFELSKKNRKLSYVQEYQKSIWPGHYFFPSYELM